MMGYEWADNLTHSQHGFYRFKDGAMSTRKGTVILLFDILDQAVEKAAAIIEEKNPDLKNKDAVARQVGYGAVRFNDLATNKETDVTFDWDKVLNLQGKSGPYVQYTHARLLSILRKAKLDAKAINQERSPFAKDEEQAVLNQLYIYPEVLREAADTLFPHTIAEYVYKLAQYANTFYNKVPVLKEEDPHVQEARLSLVRATALVIENALRILGIDAPEEM